MWRVACVVALTTLVVLACGDEEEAGVLSPAAVDTATTAVPDEADATESPMPDDEVCVTTTIPGDPPPSAECMARFAAEEAELGSEVEASTATAPPDPGVPTAAALAAVDGIPQLVGDEDWDDCRLRWLTSGFPTTTAWQPWPEEGCLAAAHAEGRGARQWFFSRDHQGGATGWGLEMDEAGRVTHTDYTVAPDGSFDTNQRTCAVADLSPAFAMPPRCP